MSGALGWSFFGAFVILGLLGIVALGRIGDALASIANVFAASVTSEARESKTVSTRRGG